MTSSDSHVCIWCGQLAKSSLEHILPDALGCPPELVLKAGVCEKCNNGLGHLDQALLHQFEIIAYMNGVRRKGGRPPAIHSWGPIAGAHGANGPEIHFNAGPGVIEALGKNLPATKPAQGISNAKFTAQDGVGTVTFDQKFGDDPKFIRALYKVAYETVAFQFGLEAVRGDLFAPVRNFVRTGQGDFRVLMLEATDPAQAHHFGPPWTVPGSPYFVMAMAIFGVNFMVDFDPEQKGLKHFRETVSPMEPMITIPPL